MTVILRGLAAQKEWYMELANDGVVSPGAVTTGLMTATETKLEAVASILAPHADRINRSRTKIQLKDGCITKYAFKLNGKNEESGDPTEYKRVIEQVQANVLLSPNCSMEFALGKLTKLEIKMASVSKPPVASVGRIRCPKFDPLSYFGQCNEAILDDLAAQTERNGPVSTGTALRLAVEDSGRRDFATEIARSGNVEKGVVGYVTRALTNQPFVRGPYTMTSAMMKNHHRNWTHGVEVTKRHSAVPHGVTSVPANLE